MSELSEDDAKALAVMLKAIDTAGDGNREKGLALFREFMVARRNVELFYKFGAWAGGALFAMLLFGKQIVEAIQFFLSFKTGGK